MKILFCCTGNTCRSPMAEYIAKDVLNKNKITDIAIASCGVMCSNGNPISDMANKALADMGIKGIEHKSKMITLRELMEYDYIFVMTKAHKEYLVRELNADENVIVLGEYVGMGDVSDPYGGNLADYLACRNQLNIMIEKAFRKLDII